MITAARLLDACGDDSSEAGVSIRSTLEPLAGRDASVKPPIYAGGMFQLDRRWWTSGSGEVRPVDAVVIDNVPSQANRLEAALEELRPSLGLPELILDLGEVGPLPPHLPRRLSSFRFPHRQADAYLRDAVLDGEPFGKTAIGEALLAATADAPEVLLEWFPQALLFGFWQSHLGKKGSQAKLARSWVSEIVGYEPASSDTHQLGLKGDPLNLNITERVSYDEDDQSDWEFVEGAPKKGGSKKQESLAELGHGQVPVSRRDADLAAVSFHSIEQRATISFASLRRIHTTDPAASAAARGLLVALGLVAHVSAFGRAFHLRSSCDLRPVDVHWSWLGAIGDEPIEPMNLADSVDLFNGCTQAAAQVGLPVGTRWASEPLVLQPRDDLAKVIRSTYPPLD